MLLRELTSQINEKFHGNIAISWNFVYKKTARDMI